MFDTLVFRNDYSVEHKVPISEIIEVDGEKHTVYPIWINKDQSFIQHAIPSGKLGITGLMEKFPLKVYIQQHAINRLTERLTDILGVFNYIPIVQALLSDPIACTDGSGFLFPLEYDNLHLGYLKGGIFNDKLVIRTFLFITNNGTPEGEKLHQMLGLQKPTNNI